jgi:hypothetical protein
MILLSFSLRRLPLAARSRVFDVIRDLSFFRAGQKDG